MVHLDLPYVEIARPFRVKRSKVVREGELERVVRQAVASRQSATSVLILLDADRDCPADLGPVLLGRASAATDLPVRVVLPAIEIEAWVLADVESVRGVRGIASDAVTPEDPESVRDAKKALSSRMEGARGYVATSDLPALMTQLDLDGAAQRSSSFQKLCRDVISLCG